MRESFQATPEAEAAIVERPKREIAKPQTTGVIGDIRTRDFQLPKLKLVGKQSELVNDGAVPGTFIIGDDVNKVADGKTPLRIVVISVAKEYWEKLEIGSDQRAQVYTTLEEVHEAGGTIEWDDPDSTQYQECARCSVLVQTDEPISSSVFEVDGKHYTPATWFLSGTAYGSVGRKFITDGSFALREKGLHSRFYDVTAKIASNAKASWFMPIVRLSKDEVPAELIDQLKAFFNR